MMMLWLPVALVGVSLPVARAQAPAPVCPPTAAGGNLTTCCDRVVAEAKDACLEYSRFGFTDQTCKLWEAEVRTACSARCGNCTGMASVLNEICKFTLQVLGNAPLIGDYCDSTHSDFLLYRCPSACQANPNACFSEEASECMKWCGNYYTCRCRKKRGYLIDEDECYGLTVVGGPVPGRIGLDYACDASQVNVSCRHHRLQGACATKYRWCEPDLCVIKDIQCVPPDQCKDEGLCDPHEGTCFFLDRQRGSPCDDGIDYTVGDHCDSGACLGEVDHCLKHNVTCAPISQCITGGVCNPTTGRCGYDLLPDGTACDDGRPYTVEDRCLGGFCSGRAIDLCMEMAVQCPVINECYVPGVCDPLTGQCSAAVPAPNTRSCDDGDPQTVNDTCTDGVCLGFPTVMEFKTLGQGTCADRNGQRMDQYVGDVASEDDCEQACREDAQCSAYAYSYPLCSIYGTVRTRAPPEASREWLFQLGSKPTKAVIIESALGTSEQQRTSVCRLRGEEGDYEEPLAPGKIPAVSVYAPVYLVIFFIGLTIIYFIRPILKVVKIFLYGPSATATVSPSPSYDGVVDVWEGEKDDELRQAAAAAVAASHSNGFGEPPAPEWPEGGEVLPPTTEPPAVDLDGAPAPEETAEGVSQGGHDSNTIFRSVDADVVDSG